MKKNDVKVGGVYAARVSDKVVPVRIDAENPHGGWGATNQVTGKKVRIKSAQRLRGPWPKKVKKATKEAGKAHGRDRGQRRGTSAKTAKAATKGEAVSRAMEAVAKAKKKPLSILDAAAKVLEERDPADGPLSCKQMVERMAAKGYWSPRQGGLTPANTLYSALLREIKTKGEDSRFDKVERGRFALSLKKGA